MTPHERDIAALRDLLAGIASLDCEANHKEISNEDAQSNLNEAVSLAREALEVLDRVVS